jgi:uncharacterized spore protein YtfJ
MGCDDRARKRWLRVETVREEPYYIGERKLTPVTRIVSFSKGRGTVGAGRISGWGGGFAWIKPLAFIEESADGEVRIPINDATATALRGMLAGAVAIVLFFTVIRFLVRRGRKALSAEE